MRDREQKATNLLSQDDHMTLSQPSNLSNLAMLHSKRQCNHSVCATHPKRVIPAYRDIGAPVF